MRNNPIPYSHQWIDNEDIQAVLETLKGDWITQGPIVAQFEEAIAEFTGAKYAVVLSSGTAALHAAYFATNIGQGNEIITSPITFLSTANAALFLNARPVFVDVEGDTGNINPSLIEGAITPKTKAIVPVHYGGHPAHLEKISETAKKFNLLVVEDACHALGAQYEEEKIGSCQHSDMAVFSFHPLKSITTGEGGAVTTNSREFHERLLMFRQHGVTKDRTRFMDPSAGDWCHEMQILGYNYRITDFQCALGISQLRKLPEFIQRRRWIAELYQRSFKGNDCFDNPEEKDYAKSSWNLYPIRLKHECKSKRQEIFDMFRGNRLGVQVHYIPVYWQPYYQKLGYEKGICPVAEDFYQREISIPLYPAMSNEDVEYVIRNIPFGI